MMLGIIGGSGLCRLETLAEMRAKTLLTPYGDPSSSLIFGRLSGLEVVFLARHGADHTLSPHQINYRANLAALRQSGVTHVIGVAAVGGITPSMAPQQLVLPDQIIDYTYGRAHTFFEQGNKVAHVDFSYPYSERLRSRLMAAAVKAEIDLIDGGCYGCTQGPRLETVAEIQRMERDGCDLVGMTGMPEAVLARELEMEYVCLAVVVNWAAGKCQGIVSMTEIEGQLRSGMVKVRKLLDCFASLDGALSE